MTETHPEENKESTVQKIGTKSVQPHCSPIFQTSVYDYPDLESLDDFYEGRLPGAFLYSRNGLPNSKELGELVATYEGTDGGVVCASGMGAITVAILSTLKAGDRLAASNDSIWGNDNSTQRRTFEISNSRLRLSILPQLERLRRESRPERNL